MFTTKAQTFAKAGSRALRNIRRGTPSFPNSATLITGLSGIVMASFLLQHGNTYIQSETNNRSFSTISQTSTSQTQQSKQTLQMLSDDQENFKLRQNEESYNINRPNGILRYDINQLASNNPIEDDRSELMMKLDIEDPITKTTKSSDWAFWGVYDGHSGWYTSAKLRDELIHYVVNELAVAYKPSESNPQARVIPTSEEIDIAIKKGFLKLDNEMIINGINETLNNLNNKPKAAELLMPGFSGSCGLLSFYDSSTNHLKVAVTGDSRALLGSLNDKNEWVVNSLSIDQTGSNKDEASRVQSEHPGERNAVARGRILGRLEPSRAFGDGRFKWAKDLQEKIRKELFNFSIPSNLHTPPYVTAEPVVTTTTIDPKKNNFLVMATDGLYEFLTNEEIAGLVIKWAEEKKIYKSNEGSLSKMFNILGEKNDYPKVEDITNDKSQLKPPIRVKHDGSKKKIILEDENVATHLIRNALTYGSGDRNYGKMILNIPPGSSRNYRDDLTVVVVFFGENGEVSNSDNLTVNLDATQGGKSRPKL